MVKGENWLPQMSLACTCSCIYTYKIKKCNNYKTKESRGRSTSTSWLHNFVKLKFTCKIIITLELFHIPFLIVPSWQWYNHPGIPLSLLCTCPPTVSLAIQSCKIHWSSINLLGHLYFSFIIALHHFICLFYLAKAKKMIKLNYIFLPITIWLIQKLCVHVYVHKCFICAHICVYACGYMRMEKPASFPITPLCIFSTKDLWLIWTSPIPLDWMASNPSSIFLSPCSQFWDYRHIQP